MFGAILKRGKTPREKGIYSLETDVFRDLCGLEFDNLRFKPGGKYGYNRRGCNCELVSKRDCSMKQWYLMVITGISIVVLFIGFSTVKGGSLPEVPEALKVPANQALSLETQGAGVQIYECKAANDDPLRFEWVFKAPEAELFDNSGKKIGRHYAGPTWESIDGSKVVGEVKAKNNGPDPNAIPWLLLSAKANSGSGVFSKTKSIQRLFTFGGKAPAEGCSQAQVGKEARITYKAKYYFYIAKP